MVGKQVDFCLQGLRQTATKRNESWRAAAGLKPSHFENVIFLLSELFLSETIVRGFVCLLVKFDFTVPSYKRDYIVGSCLPGDISKGIHLKLDGTWKQGEHVWNTEGRVPKPSR